MEPSKRYEPLAVRKPDVDVELCEASPETATATESCGETTPADAVDPRATAAATAAATPTVAAAGYSNFTGNPREREPSARIATRGGSMPGRGLSAGSPCPRERTSEAPGSASATTVQANRGKSSDRAKFRGSQERNSAVNARERTVTRVAPAKARPPTLGDGVAVAERDRGGLQRPAAGRAALIGDLRHAGGGAVPDRSVEALLQPLAYPAGAWKVTPAAFAATCLAMPPLRLAALACTEAQPGMQGATPMHQLSQRVDR